MLNQGARPDFAERGGQVFGIRLGMKGRCVDPKALRTARDRRVVYWLNVDIVFVQKDIADLPAEIGVSHHYGHNVTRISKMRYANVLKSAPEQSDPAVHRFPLART